MTLQSGPFGWVALALSLLPAVPAGAQATARTKTTGAHPPAPAAAPADPAWEAIRREARAEAKARAAMFEKVRALERDAPAALVAPLPPPVAEFPPPAPRVTLVNVNAL